MLAIRSVYGGKLFYLSGQCVAGASARHMVGGLWEGGFQLYAGLQPHGIAGSSSTWGHITGGRAHRRADRGAPLALGRGARRWTVPGRGAGRLAAAATLKGR